MKSSLSATGTYNYNLAKWLEQKLKPLSLNEYTISNAFAFADEICTHTKQNVRLKEFQTRISFSATTTHV